MTTIYHNPRCSKSRQTLALLEENDIPVNIIKYLETPPTSSELSTVLKQLGMSPKELMRKGEEQYKTLNLANSKFSDDALIDIMTEHPKLIERPIVIHNNCAKIGRPPESVLALFK